MTYEWLWIMMISSKPQIAWAVGWFGNWEGLDGKEWKERERINEKKVEMESEVSEATVDLG